MVYLADTHCHLDFATFTDDRSAVIERAENAGIDRILNPGVDLETSQKAIELAESCPYIYAAVGVHPNDAHTWQENTCRQLEELAHHARVVAIGEIGLDFYHEQTPIDLQREIFCAQLELAAETGLPVIIHSRQALDATLALVTEWRQRLDQMNHPLAARPGVFHSFEGSLEESKRVLDLNFMIGISGPVTFKNAPIKHELAAGLPLETILTETDAPFLTPHPFRGRRNEPSYVRWVADTIAALRNQPISTVAEITTQNAARLFAWSH